MYKASFENGLIENELDHVFIGFSDDKPKLNPSEVCDYRYIYSEQLLKEIESTPEQFTPWFKICINKVLESQYYIQKNALIA